MATKRKMFADAVELLSDDNENSKAEGSEDVQLIPIDKIRAFKDHPFRLYEGKRLEDIIRDIRNEPL